MPDKRKTLLIVDDQEDARAFAEAVVSEIGDFDILTAVDGGSGVRAAREAVPDLIILDVMMPGKDGFHAFCDIRQDENLADTPVIMLTGLSEQTGVAFSERDMADYLGAEPAAFLDKPVDPEKLQKTVREVLGM